MKLRRTPPARRVATARVPRYRRCRLQFETLECRRLLAGDVQLRFEFTDPAGVPVDSVGVGEPVRLRAFVQDIRETPQGVSSAYVDLIWDNPRVLATGDPIVHGPDYDMEISGDATMFPRIEDVGGGFDGLAPEAGEEGNEFLLFTIPMVGSAAGTFQFHPEAADGFGRDILLVGSGTPVAFDPENVMVVGDTSLEVVPTVAFEQAVSDVNEADGSHTVNVVLDTGGAPLAEELTVSVANLPSSSATGSHFTLDTTSVTFPASSTGGTMPVSLTISQNDLQDGNVHVDLGLAVPSTADVGLGHMDRHQVTIVDDDLDRVEIEVNLYANQNGQPGVILNQGVVNTGESFFVEIVVGDYRDDPPAEGEQRGVIGLRVDSFSWPLANLVSLNEFPIDNPLNPLDPNPLVTAEFPLSRSASLVNLGGGALAIEDLVGFSNPTGGQGTAIGVNRPQRFSLMQFVANTPTATAVALPLNVDTDTITLADNSDVLNTMVEQSGVRVNNYPVAANDHFGVDGDTSNTMLDVLGNDTDAQGEDLEITAVSAPTSGGTVSIVGTPGAPGHQLMYTPPADFRGSETFTYTITDGNQLTEATAIVTVDVDPLRVEKAVNAADPNAPTAAEDADTAPGPFLPVGSDVVWTYQVFNEGSRPLDISEIVDNAGTPDETLDDFFPDPVEAGGVNVGDDDGDGLLDPGEVWRFTSQGVSNHVAEAGQYANTALVTADAPDNGDVLTATDPAHYFGADAQLALVKRTEGEEADTAPGVFVAAGGAVEFTYELSNPGNVALQVTQLSDDNGTPGDTADDFNPAPSEMDGFNVGDTDQDGLVDPGETWLFTATRPMAAAGQHTNEATVTVSAVDAEGNVIDGLEDLQASDVSNHFGVQIEVGDVQVSKQTEGAEADETPGPFLPVGSTATFDYSVTLAATANVPVELSQIIDDNGTPGDTSDDFTPVPVPSTGANDGDTNQNGLIDPGETWLFTATRIVTAGQYTNTADVTVTPVAPDGSPLPQEFTPLDVQESSSHFGTEPAIDVEKSTNDEDADDPPGPNLPIGGTATFRYEVSNPGNVPLELGQLLDDNGTPGDAADDFAPTPIPATGTNQGDTNANGLLDPGEVWLFEATRDPVTAGQYTNTATVVGNPVDFEGNDLADFADVTDSDASNHFGNPVIIEKATNAVDPANPTDAEDADQAPGRFLPVGTSLIWTYLVSNAGQEPLSNVQIVDDFGTPGNQADDFAPLPVLDDVFNVGDVNQNGLIDQGETWRYTSDGVVSPTAPVGQYTNIARVTVDIPSTNGTAEDSDPSNVFGAMAEIALEKETAGQDADNPPGPVLPVGGTADFVYTVGNPGNVPLDVVEIVDDNGTPDDAADDFNPLPSETSGFNVGDSNQNGLLDPTEIWTYTAQRNPVTEGQYANTATIVGNPVDAQGNDLDGLENVEASDMSHHLGADVSLAVQKTTEGDDADTAPGPFLAVGSTVMFEYAVTNDGNVILELSEILDDNGTPDEAGDDFTPNPVEINFRNVGDANANGLIDPGETWLFEASSTVTAGQYTNEVTAVANPVDEQGQDIPSLPDTLGVDVSNHFGARIEEQDLDIQKTTNGEDADTPPGPLAGVGNTVTFGYAVSLSDDANVPAEIVSLVDDNGTPGDAGDDFTPSEVDENSDGFNDGDANQNNLLDPGETWLFEATRTVTAGQYTNVAGVTVNPVDPDGQDIADLPDLSDSDTSNHFGVNAAVTLTKQTNGQDAETAPGPVVPVDDTVTFSYSVENTGDVPLQLIQLLDDNGTPDEDLDDFQPTPVLDGDFNAGDTNDNNLIDPAEIWLFEATRTPVTAGQYANTATVTANAVDEQGNDVPGVDDVEDTDTSHHFGAQVDPAGLVVEKATDGQDADTPPGVAIVVGGSASFTYEVSLPAGTNVPVNLTSLIDDNGTPDDDADDFTPSGVDENDDTFNDGDTNQNGRIDPGETWLFSATRDSVTAGQYTNEVVATALPVDFDGNRIEELQEVTGSDASNHFGAVADAIVVEKATNGEDADDATGPLVPVGSTATFTYEVSLGANVNVPLELVELTDDNGTPSDDTDDFTPSDVDDNGDNFNDGDTNQDGLIGPGETWLFEATRTVTAGQHTNTVLVVGNPVGFDGTDIDGLDDLTDTDASNHFGAQVGEILLTKATNGDAADDAPGPVVPVGEEATFTYEASLPETANVPVEITELTDDNGTPSDTSDDFTPDDVDDDGDGFNDGDTDEDNLLDPGETWLFAATRTVTAGQYTNTAAITGNPVDSQGNDIPGLQEVTDTASSNHFGAQIDSVSVEKSTNGEDADSPPGPELPEGTEATFTYEVSVPTPGNVPVTISELVDDNGTPADDTDDFTPTEVDEDNDGFNDGDTNENNLVDPGETWLFEATRTVTIGQYTNTVTLTAQPVDFEGDAIAGLNELTDTDSSSHLGIEGPSTLAGAVYLDTNGNGMRDTLDGGELEQGIPGVLIALFDDDGMQVAETRTDDDGAYRFEDVLPGTYQLLQAQPQAFIDGSTSAGDFGGTPEVNQIVEIMVPPNEEGEGYNFGELSIAPQYISKRLFLASSPPFVEILRDLVEAGEDPIPVNGNGGETGEGESASLSLLDPEDLPSFPAEGEGQGSAAARLTSLRLADPAELSLATLADVGTVSSGRESSPSAWDSRPSSSGFAVTAADDAAAPAPRTDPLLSQTGRLRRSADFWREADSHTEFQRAVDEALAGDQEWLP